ncbi:MAG TPA: trigger factor [Candidatus Bathyarchaeia archaeon]|nr:trigger factor [Candidatus Bathyarchaeia archaeon]
MTDNETNDTNQNTDAEPEAPAAPAAETATEVAAEPATEEGEEKEFEFVEDPVFDVDYKGDCAYEVKVTVPLANEAKLSEDVFEELRKDAEVPGFRRGRAPRKLIERKFAKAVRSDVELKLVSAAFQKLVKDKDLSPLGLPEIEGLEKEKEAERKQGEPLVFTLKFEVRPRVELGKYRGIEVERPVFKVEDKDIDEAIDNVRARFGVYETVEKGKAKDGDQAVIDFKGAIDGEEFPGGAANDYPYILGTKRFFPEFEQALLGAKPGQTVQCEVHFPDDYSAQHVRGKVADFEIRVKELKRRNIPELTDEFAKQAGYETAEDMRSKVAERLRATASNEGNSIAEERALKNIIASSTFEIPKSLVEKIVHGGIDERVQELVRARVPAAEIEERMPEIRAKAEQAAINSIKSWTVLQEIAEAEGIEVTDEDFEQEAQAISQRSGATLEAAAQYMGEEERRDRYAMRFLQAKTLHAVMGHANVVDKELTPEEFKKEVEADSPEEAGTAKEAGTAEEAGTAKEAGTAEEAGTTEEA